MMSRGLLRRGGLLLLLAAVLVCAQFSQLAATDDGKQLYFTSQMMFKGATAGQGREYRLFHAGAEGLALVLERGALASTSSFSSSSGVTNVSVTGDAGLLGYSLNDICSLPGCANSVVQIRGKQSMDLGQGTVELSRNGRWALWITSTDVTERSTLIDLTTNQRTVVNETTDWTPHQFKTLASDGTVLIALSRSVALWKQGKLTPLTLPANPIAITDDGSTLIGYYSKGPVRLVTMNPASGKATVVAQAANSLQPPVFMGASNDGRRILYRLMTTNANGPAYVWDAATGASWPIPLEDGELATDGTLTGAGDIAFVATSCARIVKFAVQPGGAVSLLFAATPYCDDPGAVAGGSLARLHCTFNLTAADLDGKVLYGGNPMPVVYSRPEELGLQVPWQWDNFGPNIISFQIATALRRRSKNRGPSSGTCSAPLPPPRELPPQPRCSLRDSRRERSACIRQLFAFPECPAGQS
jgi:hypothetical protein